LITPGTYDVDCSYFNSYDQVLVLTGKTIDNSVPYAKSSFKNLLKSLDTVFSIGAGIEIINNIETLIIKAKEDFYDNTTIIKDLGEVDKVEISVNKDLIINELSIGYPKQEYQQGTDPSNETNQGSTYAMTLESLPAPKKIDLISIYRADYTGLIDILANNIYDNQDIFFLHIKWDTPSFPLRQVPKDENLRKSYAPVITYVVYNALITPQRCYNNWVKYFNSIFYGVTNAQIGFELINSDTDNIHNETTTNFGNWISENSCALFANNLFFKPINFKFTAIIEKDFLSEFINNPYGIYQFTYNGNIYYGFLFDEAKIKVTENSSAELTLLCAGITDLILLK
jgi:hypothetical protein